MSDDLASAVERFDAIVAAMDAEIDECYPEPEARAEMRDRWTVTRPIQLSDLRLILSALKDAGEALCASPSRYDRGDCCGFPDNCPPPRQAGPR